MSLFMRPRNWREYQHYHDGRPNKWVKNYLSLDDPSSKFRQLSWADQGRLQALWRIACRLENNGMIPVDEGYLRSALGDKRFTIASHLVQEWFHFGTQKELKRLANREIRASEMMQASSLRSKEVRSKKPLTPSGKDEVQKLQCPECDCAPPYHHADCSRRAA